MSLSTRQLAKLRQLGRFSNELELRHKARRAAIATQREYLATLNRKLERLPLARNAAIQDKGATRDQHDAAVARYDHEEKRLRVEIQSARSERDHLQAQLARITQVSAPLRELVDRVLVSANLSRGDAGVAFGVDDAARTSEDALEVG